MLRRLFVVLFATLIGVSVLVVAGSPAHAANTASESLFDDDGDATTASVRRFAGDNRYATAAALAAAYTESTDAGGFVNAVIVASGESIVDASAAAGLAGVQQVPVLLTATDELTSETEDFIEDEFIDAVYIVGGTSAISQSVEDELNALATVSSVTRLAGDDRYSTSVRIAEEMGELEDYCETQEPAAIIVNVDNSFADVIAIGPLAYVHSLPILLTSATQLSASVSDYLEDNNIEQVFVVGGTSAVSQSVTSQLTAIGVLDITRLAGDDRYATAVDIRNELANCSTIALSGSTVGLINGSAAADGVAAGPLLGAGLVSPGQVTPVLLVSADGVPAATAEFLANTPVRSASGAYLDYSFTAIGGLSVVPEAVMTAAIAAATTSAPITASIAATVANEAFTTTATVSFSAHVDQATATNKDNYLLNGARLLRDDTLELIDTSSNTAPSTVRIAIGRAFESGDEITVVGNRIKGRATDNRLAQEATYTVTDVPRADRSKPRIEIVAGENAHELRIRVDEANPGPVGIDITKIRLNNADLPWTKTLTNRRKVVRTQHETTISRAQTTTYATDNNLVASNVAASHGAESYVQSLLSGYSYTATTDTPPCVRSEVQDDGTASPPTSGVRVGPETRTYRAPAAGDDTARNIPDCPELQYFGLPLPDWTIPTAEAVYHMGDRTNFRVCLFGVDDSTNTVDPPCVDTFPSAADATDRYSSTSPDDPTYYEREYGLTDLEGLGVLVDGRFIRYKTSFGTTTRTLNAGDRITIEAGAITDAFGNQNNRTTFTVKANANQPELERAAVSKRRLYDANGDAPGGEALSSWAWAEYAWWCGESVSPSLSTCTDADAQVDVVANYLTITAKADGDAAGAAGNAWSVNWQQLDSDEFDGDGVPTVQIAYLSHRGTIGISFDAEATVEDAYNALLADEDFNENFDVTSDGTRIVGSAAAVAGWPRDPSTISNRALGTLDFEICTSTTLRPSTDTCTMIPVAGADNSAILTKGTTEIRGAPSSDTRRLSGGESAVTITLTYDDVLETFKYASDPAAAGTLVEDNRSTAVVVAADGTITTAAVETGYPVAAGWSTPSEIRIVQGTSHTCTVTATLTCTDFSEFTVAQEYPTLTSVITFVLHSPNLNRLPDSDDTINLPTGVATNYDATPVDSVAVPEQDLRAS